MEILPLDPYLIEYLKKQGLTGKFNKQKKLFHLRQTVEVIDVNNHYH